MAAAGEAAEEALQQALANPEGFICVVEGAIPTAENGIYGTIAGRTMLDICTEVLPKAKAVVAYGTCACFGGIPAAAPNPTGAKASTPALPTRASRPSILPAARPTP